MQPVRMQLDLDKEPQERYVLSIRQGEVNATVLEVEVADHGEAVDLGAYSVFFECAHPNGALHSEKVGSTSGNVATYTVAKAVGGEAGTIECAYFALKVTNDDGTTDVYATTQAFLIRVLPNAQTEGAGVAKAYSSEIEAMLAYCKQTFDANEAQRQSTFDTNEVERQTASEAATKRANDAADLVKSAIDGTLDPLFKAWVDSQKDVAGGLVSYDLFVERLTFLSDEDFVAYTTGGA